MSQIAMRFIRRRVGEYQNELRDLEEEAWLEDHKEAMDAADVDAVIGNGCRVFHDICNVDESFRLQFYKGRPFDAEIHSRIRSLFAEWAGISKDGIKLVAKFEKMGRPLENAVSYRKCIAEVTGILSADDEFFPGEKLAALEKQALRDYADGKTQAMNDPI